MRTRSIGVALALALVGGAAARAVGGATPAAVGGPTPTLSNGSVGAAGQTATGPLNPVASTTGSKSVGTTATNLPPPPPPTLTTPPALTGVPPTPAPSVAGLPTPSSDTRVLPSQTGLSGRIENELRPAASLSAAQVADIQASLAAGGLYRGPINGVLSASTRAAVREFQAIERLPPTGELDAETLARLVNGKSSSTPPNSGTATLGGGVGSGGTTSTAGTPNVVDPFTGGSTPFPLSAPVNMSPSPPPGTLIQP